MFNTKQEGTAQVLKCMIRVKDGTLASKGKGTFTIIVMPEGKVFLSMTLPSGSGVPKRFDLGSLERLELVKTRPGWYQGNQWIRPTVAVVSAVVVPSIFIVSIHPPYSIDWTLDSFGVVIGMLLELMVWGSVVTAFSVPALIYAGSKLPRIVRFVAGTHDGRYCVAEMPDTAFRVLQATKGAVNLHVQTDAAVSTTKVPEIAPAPT